MNLTAYDDVEHKLDKTKTWIDVKYKRLLSRELVPRLYYKILSRYDITSNSNNYFLALFDNYTSNIKPKLLKYDDFGRIKINVTSIWNNTSLHNLNKNTNINIQLIENQEDGEIYYLDI